MFYLVRSELLKMHHTFALKLFIAAPIITLGLGYFLSGKSVQLTAYNWWYALILPITIAIWCASLISCEKRTQYQNIFCLPISMKKVWLSKLLAVTVLLFLTSLIMWGGCTVFGIFTVMNIDPLNGLTGLCYCSLPISGSFHSLCGSQKKQIIWLASCSRLVAMLFYP